MAEAKTASKKASTTTKAKAIKVEPVLKELLEAGAHFGHRSERWNPKMQQYIFGVRNGVHILDLTQTAPQLATAEKTVYELAKTGGQILFVGTKRQAKPIVQKYAKDAGMPYVTYRWLGGMLTNLDTIKLRIQRLKKLETQKAEDDFAGVIKKEKLKLEEEMQKLQKTFDGVRDLYGTPAAIYVVDMPKEDIAVAEAHKLKIPVIAMADTNADPELATYPIASNDDAIKSIDYITGKIAAAAKRGAEEYKAKAQSEEVTTGE